VSEQPEPIKIREMGYTIPTNQIQYLERTLQTNHNGMNLSDKECYGMGKRETDIYDLCTNVKSVDSLNVPWSTTDAIGTILWKTPIGPFSNLNEKCPAPMDLFALNFNFWTGGVIYIFEVIASTMHHGRLTITYHPNLSAPPNDLSLATQQYFTSFDLQNGKGTIAIFVPYLAKTPYRPIHSIRGNEGNRQPYNFPAAFFNGCIALRVQNCLRGTTSVAPAVQINIYRMAAKDFRMDVYGSVSNCSASP
jgi:hypothetical protein